jgi:hypothetical protein
VGARPHNSVEDLESCRGDGTSAGSQIAGSLAERSGFEELGEIRNVPIGVIPLCRSEHQIGEKPCGTSVSVNEWVDPDCLGMGDNTQFMWRPVVGVFPSIEDRVQRIAEVDSNLLVWNADVDIMRVASSRVVYESDLISGIGVS